MHSRTATANQIDFSKKNDQETEQQHTLQKTAEEQGTHCRSWMSKGPCKCLFGHDTAEKGKNKKNRSRSPIKKTDDSAERQCVRKTEQSPSGKEHRPPCFNCTTGTHCHDRECHCWHSPALQTRQSQHQSFDKEKKKTNSHLNVIQTGSKNGRSPNAPPYDQKTTVWKEEQENFYKARRYQLHKEVFKTKGHYSDVNKTNFFGSYVPTKSEEYRVGLGDAYRRKDVHRRQWRFVTCDVLLLL